MTSKPRPVDARFAKVDEVAGMLQVSKMTVYRLVENQKLPAYRIGRGIRIPINAVWKYVEDQRVTREKTA